MIEKEGRDRKRVKMRKGEEKGHGGKLIVTSGCYDHYPIVSMSLSLTQCPARCRAHSYTSKPW